MNQVVYDCGGIWASGVRALPALRWLFWISSFPCQIPQRLSLQGCMPHKIVFIFCTACEDLKQFFPFDTSIECLRTRGYPPFKTPR